MNLSSNIYVSAYRNSYLDVTLVRSLFSELNHLLSVFIDDISHNVWAVEGVVNCISRKQFEPPTEHYGTQLWPPESPIFHLDCLGFETEYRRLAQGEWL
jgi:hypothetical protein